MKLNSQSTADKVALCCNSCGGSQRFLDVRHERAGIRVYQNSFWQLHVIHMYAFSRQMSGFGRIKSVRNGQMSGETSEHGIHTTARASFGTPSSFR